MQAWQPQYDGCCVVNKQFSWASLPFKGTFSSGPDHGKNVVVKGFSAFILAQRCQMERVRICKHVNPHKRKLSPSSQSLRVHSACWKFPVLEQHKCAFDKMPFNWRKTGMWSYAIHAWTHFHLSRLLKDVSCTVLKLTSYLRKLQKHFMLKTNTLRHKGLGQIHIESMSPSAGSPVRPPLTRSSEVKGELPPRSAALHTTSCLRPQRPTLHLSGGLQPFISDLSCHHTHYNLSHSDLIDDEAFDNSIRYLGVCLVIRCNQILLIRGETPSRRMASTLCRYDWSYVI